MMFEEMKMDEMVTMGNSAFYTYLKGISLNKKLNEVKQVHDEIMSVVGHGLKQVIILKEKAKKYQSKCQELGLEVKSDGPFGLGLVLSESLSESEIDEKVALLNKALYAVKAEGAN